MKHRGLMVWGGGGHGRVVAETAMAAGMRVEGFIDRKPAPRPPEDSEHGLVWLSEDTFRRDPLAALLEIGAEGVALGIGNNQARFACLDSLGSIHLPELVHPTAYVSVSAELGRGSVILPRAVVHTAARLAGGVVVNSGAVVEHDCNVGDGAHIAPGAILAGGVTVGARTLIGAGAVVIEGVRVGQDVVVGAGAVVIRDVRDGMTVVGNPAHPIIGNVGHDTG